MTEKSRNRSSFLFFGVLSGKKIATIYPLCTFPKNSVDPVGEFAREEKREGAAKKIRDVLRTHEQRKGGVMEWMG